MSKSVDELIKEKTGASYLLSVLERRLRGSDERILYREDNTYVEPETPKGDSLNDSYVVVDGNESGSDHTTNESKSNSLGAEEFYEDDDDYGGIPQAALPSHPAYFQGFNANCIVLPPVYMGKDPKVHVETDVSLPELISQITAVKPDFLEFVRDKGILIPVSLKPEGHWVTLFYTYEKDGHGLKRVLNVYDSKSEYNPLIRGVASWFRSSSLKVSDIASAFKDVFGITQDVVIYERTYLGTQSWHDGVSCGHWTLSTILHLAQDKQTPDSELPSDLRQLVTEHQETNDANKEAMQLQLIQQEQKEVEIRAFKDRVDQEIESLKLKFVPKMKQVLSSPEKLKDAIRLREGIKQDGREIKDSSEFDFEIDLEFIRDINNEDGARYKVENYNRIDAAGIYSGLTRSQAVMFDAIFMYIEFHLSSHIFRELSMQATDISYELPEYLGHIKAEYMEYIREEYRRQIDNVLQDIPNLFTPEQFKTSRAAAVSTTHTEPPTPSTKASVLTIPRVAPQEPVGIQINLRDNVKPYQPNFQLAYCGLLLVAAIATAIVIAAFLTTGIIPGEALVAASAVGVVSVGSVIGLGIFEVASKQENNNLFPESYSL